MACTILVYHGGVTEPKLTHTDAHGKARMVDVSHKDVTQRTAVAIGRVAINDDLARAIEQNTLAKGNLIETARLAGIMAAKRTDQLIPLCHQLPLDGVDLTLSLEANAIVITAEARTHARTGVEMEALVAVTVAALTVIDMGKAIDKRMRIEGVHLLRKSGGASGDFTYPQGGEP